ncbi:MAG TPA: hypothetical protein VIS96_05160 [Terrimicrobiaceae bacterium]
MSNESSNEKPIPAENVDSLDRRLFLRSIGKWSGAAIVAAVAGAAWVASSPEATAGVWVNRRGAIRGGGWINGGGWVNRAGGWLNGRGGGGGWVNRRVGGGSGWINRW